MNAETDPGNRDGASAGSELSWKPTLLSALADIGMLVVVAAGVGGLYWAGIPGSRRVLAVVGVVGAVGALSFGAWLGTRIVTRPGSLMIGGLAALLVIVVVAVSGWLLAAPVMDVRSVAIALDWIEAPNVGTGPSEALNRLRTALPENPSTESPGLLSGEDRHAVISLVFLGMMLLVLVLTGVLGGAVNRRGASARSSDRDLWRQPLVGLGATVVGAAVLAAVAWPSVWAMSNAVVDFDQSSGPEVGVNLSEVVNHPDTMWSQTVTVSANVHQVAGPHVALIGSDTRLVGNTLMIVSEPPLEDQVLQTSTRSVDLDKGDVVQVTGTVRRFDPAALQSDLGISLAAEQSAKYQGSSVLVVNAIDPDVPAAAEAGDPEFGAGGTAAYDSGVTIDDVIHNTEANLGLTVTVSGEVEETILTPHAFVLGDQGLLAISAEARPELFVEATAYVEGEVRIFDIAEVEQETGLDLDDERLRPFEGKPYLLVASVTIVT